MSSSFFLPAPSAVFHAGEPHNTCRLIQAFGVAPRAEWVAPSKRSRSSVQDADVEKTGGAKKPRALDRGDPWGDWDVCAPEIIASLPSETPRAFSSSIRHRFPVIKAGSDADETPEASKTRAGSLVSFFSDSEKEAPIESFPLVRNSGVEAPDSAPYTLPDEREGDQPPQTAALRNCCSDGLRKRLDRKFTPTPPSYGGRNWTEASFGDEIARVQHLRRQRAYRQWERKEKRKRRDYDSDGDDRYQMPEDREARAAYLQETVRLLSDHLSAVDEAAVPAEVPRKIVPIRKEQEALAKERSAVQLPFLNIGFGLRFQRK